MAYKDEVRTMTDDELLEAIAGWRPGTEQYLICSRELRRRDGKWETIRSWAAITISLIAIAVSIFAK